MGRTSPSLQYELINRVLPKIQNNRTKTSYKKHIKNFAKWARERGYKRPEQITRDVIQEYEQYLESDPKEYSPSTIHSYISPVCKAVDVPMDRIRKPKRSASSITRGRRRDVDGQEVARNRQGDRELIDPRFARLVALQSVVGIRRSELARLTGADLVQRGRSLYVVVQRGKGGKRQEQYVLPQDVDIVRNVFADIDPEQKVFSPEEMNNKLNLHGLRAEHGKTCYEHYENLISNRPGAADQLRKTLLQRWDNAHERLYKENSESWKLRRQRFIRDMDDRPYVLRGDNAAKASSLGLPTEYSRLALMCVSVLHLSHWRLDVTVTNYLLG